MSTRSLYPAPHGNGAADGLHDDDMPAPALASRACCCPARAVVRVVLPPTADRPHETDLLLCGHHYRVSRQALAEAYATVREIPLPGALSRNVTPSHIPRRGQ
jgi:hypothetical protein